MQTPGFVPQQSFAAPFHHGIKAKHRKAIRKRHIIAIVLELLVLTLLMYTFLQFCTLQNAAQQGVLQLSQKALAGYDETDKTVLVRSSLGYQFSYHSSLYAVSVATASGKLQRVVGQDRSEGAYAAMEFTLDRNPYASPLRVRYHEAGAVLPTDTTQFKVTKLHEEKATLSGVSATKLVYHSSPITKPKTANVLAPLDTYLYVVPLTGKATITIAYDTVSGVDFVGYEGLLSSLVVGARVALEQGAVVAAGSVPAQLFGPAKVGAKEASMDRARLVATYAPAVVKIYHLYCGEIYYRGVSALTGCDGLAGSGFFISSNGLIATNGHVATLSPQDMVVRNMSPELLRRLLTIEGYKTAEIDSAIANYNTNASFKQSIANSYYTTAKSAFTIKNDQRFYMVALGSEKPDTEAVTKTRVFKETAYVKSAQLVDSNYNASDIVSVNGFKNSDVALLKIAGSNYPVVQLGEVSSLTQGSEITVLGFPANADDNTLTDDESLSATATGGMVSAMRTAKGGDYKLVQSDIQIGHGNSGGPAFDNEGRVFGVATYILPAADSAETSLSYIRDIQDIKDLADKNKYGVLTKSDVQQKWEQALNSYYTGHFVRAKEEFREVGRLYPAHSMVDKFMNLASTKIAAGQEAKDPKVLVSVVLGIIMTIAGIVLTVLLIIRHYRKHRLYVNYHGGMPHGMPRATA